MKRNVTQPNTVIMSQYGLTHYEKMLVVAALYRVDTRAVTPNTDVIEIDLNQLYADSGKKLAKKHFIQQMNEAAGKLHSKQIKLPKIHEKDKDHFVSWIQEREVSHDCSIIGLKLTERMAALFHNVRKEFTTVEYYSLIRLNGFYATRIYELIQKWSGIEGNQARYTLQELRDLLNAPQSYNENKLFIQKIVKPALADINKNSDIHVTLEYHKKDKKITHFVFKKQVKRIPAFGQEYIPKEKIKETHLENKDKKPVKKPKKTLTKVEQAMNEKAIEQGFSPVYK